MAITIGNIGKADTFTHTTGSNAIRQLISIKIQADGTVNTSNVNLGNQGDDGVTVLYFDISDFINDPEPFKDRYQPVIISRDASGNSQTFDFDGKYFYVPNGITRSAGVYDLVYAVWERNTNNGNVSSATEIFTSSIFTGIVKPTNFGLISQEEPETLPAVLQGSFRKPKREISYLGKVKEKESNLLGYKLDQYITFLELYEKHADLQFYVVYFTGYVKTESGNSVIQTKGYCFDDNGRCWAPPVVTDNPGDWQVMIIGYSDNGYEFVSDVFVMKVIDNKLVNDSDLDADALSDVPLLEQTQLALADSEGRPILVTQTISDQGRYVLTYVGDEIQRLLNLVNTDLDYEPGSWRYNTSERLSEVENNLSTEIQDRIDGDSTLRANLEAEIAIRQEADATLQTNIDNEAANRETADTTLQTNIDNEVTARQSADNSIINAYQTADTNLSQTITQNYKQAIKELENKYIPQTEQIKNFTLLESEEEFDSLVNSNQINTTMVYFIKENEGE